MAERFLTAGEAGVLDRLRDQAGEIEHLERLLRAAKKRRDALMAKAVRFGMTERQIAKVAGVSGPRVHQIKHAHSGGYLHSPEGARKGDGG